LTNFSFSNIESQRKFIVNKNLTTEALFDEDSESGNELIAEWKRKEAEKKNKK
jgi:hypothetical protein